MVVPASASEIDEKKFVVYTIWENVPHLTKEDGEWITKYTPTEQGEVKLPLAIGGDLAAHALLGWFTKVQQPSNEPGKPRFYAKKARFIEINEMGEIIPDEPV